MKFCIYTIGDQANGFGHVVREITLAEELLARGAEVDFVTPANTPGMLRLMASAFGVYPINGNSDWVARLGPDYEALVIDVEHGPARPFLEAVRPHFKTIVTVCGTGYTVSDPGAVMELSDLIVEQNPFGLGQHRPVTETLSGIEYMLIDPRYTRISGDRGGPIVVSMGGSDPHGVTQPIVNRLLEAGYPLRVVIGPAMSMPHFVDGARPEIWRSPENLLEVLAGARMLVGALGMTAFEAAAAGVPALLTGWTADHVRTAGYLEERGTAISLGAASHLRAEHVMPHVERVWYDEGLWHEMSEAGKGLVDGRGVERVAESLMSLRA